MARYTVKCLCGRRVAIRKDGLVQRHSPLHGWQVQPWCPHSEHPPSIFTSGAGLELAMLLQQAKDEQIAAEEAAEDEEPRCP